jgi:hypothetical protein
MESILDFVNKNSGLFSLIFSAIVAVATVVYAILTWKLVSETRRMREVQTEPNIAISLLRREDFIGFVDMLIQNIGLGPAYDVRFSLERDFKGGRRQKPLSDIGIFSRGLKYLPPNQKVQFFLTSMKEDYDEKLKTVIDLGVTYRNAVGKSYQQAFSLHLSELSGTVQVGKPPIHEIADHLKSIKEHLDNILSGFEEFNVHTFDKDDRQAETRRLKKEIKRYEKTKRGANAT